ncbi:pepsin/retropepsin-like aspartic protease family protein [Kordiimonas marina]|uniref:pepsin/retropepsin-like aspartic protease family protein n=1 Tax=Kordiimonas marina TaxID=2872312 RepID=UPI001FF4945F|nr:pepsin/retropepsin-like aspartic protease family protein [Kordiimonas marina]MCJ9429334.1 aspartyl protease family protein [Kordiimonas marina]
MGYKQWLYGCLAGLSALLASPGLPAQAASQGIVVPYRYDAEHRIMLPVLLPNEKTVYYLLDTATHFVGMTNSEVARLGLSVVNKTAIRAFATSSQLKLPATIVHSMKLGTLPLENQWVAIFPNTTGPIGAIGYRAYANRLIHLDPKRKTLGFYPNDGKFSQNGWKLVTGHANKYGAIVLETKIQGVPFDVVIASGINHSLMGWHAAEALFPGLYKHPPTHKISVSEGLINEVRSVQAKILHDVQIGNWHVGDIAVGITKLPVKEVTGYMNANLLMLGADVLTRQELVLDFRYWQVWHR